MKTRSVVAIGITVLLIMVIAGFFFVKSSQAQAAADRETCIQNLKQIDVAKEKWALEHKDRAGKPIGTEEVNEIIPYMPGGKMPRCPCNCAYWIDESGKPICSCGAALGHKLEAK